MDKEILHTINEIIKSLGIDATIDSTHNIVEEISNITGIPENVIEELINNGLLPIDMSTKNENYNSNKTNKDSKISLSVEKLFDVANPLTEIDTALAIVFEDESKLHKTGHFESINDNYKYIIEQFILKTKNYDYKVEFIRKISKSKPKDNHFAVEVTKDIYKILEVKEDDNYTTFILSVSK